ncbi:MAG TPA: ABC transporter permease [Catalimonadaceae bacterium]|jgi:ABC-2 type transport system permease protein|nr:ABC transporter permease [Catalimonadaceae bacterium]
MNKIALIIQREYLSRVTKKTFIIVTLLGPILFAAITIIPAWLAMRDQSLTTISVIDQSGLFANKFKSNNETVYVPVNQTLEEGKKKIQENGDHQLLLVIGPTDGKALPAIQLFGESNPALDLIGSIENQVEAELRNLALKESGIDPALVDKIDPKVVIQTRVLSDDGEKDGSSVAATVVGFGAGFLIYMFIFLYGTQVMGGVMEEKTNRVVEVIISSVKPFQLMMGKIVGVALVGLTQFVLWVALSFVVSQAAGVFMGKKDVSISKTESVTMNPQTQEVVNQASKKTGFLDELTRVNVPLIAGCFLFYFLGGYLLYSALFAAVGSAVDNQQDAQQFMFPITIPIILAIVMGQFIIKEPNSTLAFWMSIIPFTSPIIMMIRIPFEPPAWQIALSMVSLILGFLGTTWLAAKIYRVGILMYGKKITYGELWKWIRYSA